MSMHNGIIGIVMSVIVLAFLFCGPAQTADTAAEEPRINVGVSATDRTFALEKDGRCWTVTVCAGQESFRLIEEAGALKGAGLTNRISSNKKSNCLHPRRDRNIVSGRNWNNIGGNGWRNGLTWVSGPRTEGLIWANEDDYSIIAWHPVTLGNRVFAIREYAFPSTSGPGEELICYDLNRNDILWRTEVPYGGNPDLEWIAYIGGVDDGKVYCCRGGSSRYTPVHAFDAWTGTILWTSQYATCAGPYAGYTFAPDGDILVGDFDNAVRIDSGDGSTVWITPRRLSVSGSGGCAATADAVYIDEPDNMQQKVTKLDMATGARLYSSAIQGSWLNQNSPFLSPDQQTIFLVIYDELYAFTDDGGSLTMKWNVPVSYLAYSQTGVAADGTVYTVLNGYEFVRLDPETGAVLDSAGILSPNEGLKPLTAVGIDGMVYVSNGYASSPVGDGRIWAFSADLSSNYFTLELDRQNIGGPSLGRYGTLVVADLPGVYAYR